MTQFANSFILKNALRGGELNDLLIKDGKIVRIRPAGSLEVPSDLPQYDADGLLLFPSFIDAHTHLREPGYEYKEDIASGLTAALHGGFGAVMAMANTNPVNDNASTTRLMYEKAKAAYPYGPQVLPIGALSVGLEGKELAPMGELLEAGVKAISNDGKPVQNADLFRHAVEYAATWGLKVIDHCEDAQIASGWHMNEGAASASMGLKGQPSFGEALQVARDILISEYLNLPIHLAHISCKQSVDLIRSAKQRGVGITAETCPHYLFLDDSMFSGYDTSYKVSPPLRRPEDAAAMCEAVADGTIDILATDHAPHAAHEKEVPFDEAPCGLIGLETAVALTYGLVRKNIIDINRFEELWCYAPAEIFGLESNRFKNGDPACFFLFDPDESWVVSSENMHSKSLNTPWLGKELKGKVKAHWLMGHKLL